jgi:hypothetical protein
MSVPPQDPGWRVREHIKVRNLIVPVSLQRRCGSVWRLLMVFLCSVLCFLKRIDDAIRRDESSWLAFFIDQHNVYLAAVVAEIEIGAMRFGTCLDELPLLDWVTHCEVPRFLNSPTVGLA